MSRRFDELVARHDDLRARCAVQRLQLAHITRGIEDRLSGVDRGISLVRRIAHSPVLLAGAAALFLLLRPKRLIRTLRSRGLLRWASRGLFFYTTARRFRRLTHSRSD